MSYFSKVHGKHFLIATEGDVGDGEGGDGDSGDYSFGLNRQNACANAVSTGDSGVITATARCVCDCPSPWDNIGNSGNLGPRPTVIAVAQCICKCNGVEGPYGRCEEED